MNKAVRKSDGDKLFGAVALHTESYEETKYRTWVTIDKKPRAIYEKQ